MIKVAIGLSLAFLIGACCRWLDVPVPSPPKLVGALLVVAMTLGYLVTDKVIASRTSAGQASANEAVRAAPGGPHAP